MNACLVILNLITQRLNSVEQVYIILKKWISVLSLHPSDFQEGELDANQIHCEAF